jgi:hypothetical protein
MYDPRESYLKPAQPPVRQGPVKARRPRLGLFGWLNAQDRGDWTAKTPQTGRGYRW